MHTERQISAGGVIFRKHDDVVEVALISVKGGKVWALPKGLVEKGENIARTAHREVKEETGLDGRILENLGHVEYFYAFKDKGETTRYFKIVYFFLMEYSAGSTDGHDEEVVECRWFPIDEAVGLLKYEDEKNIVRKAKASIDALSKKRAEEVG